MRAVGKGDGRGGQGASHHVEGFRQLGEQSRPRLRLVRPTDRLQHVVDAARAAPTHVAKLVGLGANLDNLMQTGRRCDDSGKAREIEAVIGKDGRL